MLKVIILWLVAAVCLADPQGRQYSTPRRTFQGGSLNQVSRGHFSGGDSDERFSGFDSGERFSDFDSRERFSGGSGSNFQLRGSGAQFGQGHFGGSRTGFRQGHSGAFGTGLGQSHFGGSGADFRQTHSGNFGRGSSEEFTGHSSRTGGGYSSGGGHSGSRNEFSRSDGFGFSSGPVVAILRDDREDSGDGSYSFVYESADGVSRQESGTPSGNNGAVIQRGSWSFTYPDGTPAQFNFVADEGGFQVESDLLPQPHPLPAHALEQIEKAERERAAGIIHDGQYREEDHFGSGLSHGGQTSFGGSSGLSRRNQHSLGSQQFRGQSSFRDSDESYRGGHTSFRDSSENFRTQPSFRGSSESLESFGGSHSNFGGSGHRSFQRGQQSLGGSFRSPDNQGFGSSNFVSGGSQRNTGVSLFSDSRDSSRGFGSSRRFQTSSKSYGN